MLSRSKNMTMFIYWLAQIGELGSEDVLSQDLLKW
jgi:hypothetical protein